MIQRVIFHPIQSDLELFSVISANLELLFTLYSDTELFLLILNSDLELLSILYDHLELLSINHGEITITFLSKFLIQSNEKLLKKKRILTRTEKLDVKIKNSLKMS